MRPLTLAASLVLALPLTSASHVLASDSFDVLAPCAVAGAVPLPFSACSVDLSGTITVVQCKDDNASCEVQLDALVVMQADVPGRVALAYGPVPNGQSGLCTDLGPGKPTTSGFTAWCHGSFDSWVACGRTDVTATAVDRATRIVGASPHIAYGVCNDEHDPILLRES